MRNVDEEDVDIICTIGTGGVGVSGCARVYV